MDKQSNVLGTINQLMIVNVTQERSLDITET